MEIKSLQELEQLLLKEKIDLSKWTGSNGSKTLDDLYKEIEQGESEIINHGPIKRHLKVSIARIKNPNKPKYKLFELKQEYRDTSQGIRKREQDLAEKIMPGETPLQTVKRGILEEIHLGEGSYQIDPNPKEHCFDQESLSYPGLTCRYQFYIFNVESSKLPEEDFWREERSKTSRFHRIHWGWRPCVIEIASEAVREACILAEKVKSDLIQGLVVSKTDNSPVTIADLAIQALISFRLQEYFPEIPLIGEEDSSQILEDPELSKKVISQLKENIPEINKKLLVDLLDYGKDSDCLGTRFILDPIDGTKGFIKGLSYAVALACITEKKGREKIKYAFLGCPVYPFSEKGILAIAEAERGAYEENLDKTGVSKAIICNKNLEIKSAKFIESRAHRPERNRKIMNKLGVQTEGFQMDSQAKFLAIARGDSDVYLRLSSTPGRLEKIWDIVPGALIIMESGAKVSDLVGNIVSLNHGKTVGVDSLFATNANLYDKVFQAIKDVENENSNCQ